MSYKRKRNGSNGRPKKRSKAPAKAKTKVDKRQDRTIKKIKKLFAPERKWFDFQMDNTITDTYDVYDFATSLRVWDSTTNQANILRSNQREGEKVYLKGVAVRGEVKIPMDGLLLTADLTARVRMILIHVPVPPAQTPLPLGNYLVAPTEIHSLYKKPKMYDYNVLWDKTIDLVNLTSQACGVSTPLANITQVHGDAKFSWKYNLKKYFKINRMITYDNRTAAGNESYPIKNRYALYMISDSAHPTHPTMYANCRVYFQDA